MITTANIRTVAPRAADDIVDGIVKHQAFFLDFEIDTPRRLAYFFGQSAVETQGFTHNNYKQVKDLTGIDVVAQPELLRKFPRRFSPPAFFGTRTF